MAKFSREALLVVGNGMASFRLCEALCERGLNQRFRIIVVGEEPTPAYDRVHLTRYLENGEAGPLALGSLDWYKAKGMELVVGEQVERVDLDLKEAISGSGRSWSFDKLVLATGSRPFVPPVEGADKEGVFVYRTLEDASAIKSYAAGKRRALVLGGGLLGLEAANALRSLGMETSIVEFANGLMPRQLNKEGSLVLENQVRKLGLSVILGKGAQRITSQGDSMEVAFSDGSSLLTEMVVISTGIQPRDDLARSTGLLCGARGGIVVDDALNTSAPDVFAIGECALHRGQVYGFVAPAYRMAECLAGRLAGEEPVFEGSDLSCRLKLLGIEVSVFGDHLGEGKTLVYQSPDYYRMIILKQDSIVGGTVIGEWSQTHQLQLAVQENRYMPPSEQSAFTRGGVIEVAEPLNEWPGGAVVCNCTQVTKERLTSCIASGCRSISELSSATGAGTVCGSCRPLLGTLLGHEDSEAVYVPKGRKALWVATLAAVALTDGIFLLEQMASARSVQGFYFPLTKLWRETELKQISGFSMVGLSALALAISARKRVKRFRVGNFGYWRAVHSALGALCLLMLVLHTGLSLGENLNRLLAVSFLGLNAAGAAAGITVAMESRWQGPVARRIRSVVVKAHLLFFWPYPVLLGFHIYKVYFY